MDDESISFISGDALSKLLQRPISSRMLGYIEVKNTSACEFNDHEHIDQLESCRHDDEKVAGNDRFSMVAHERHPALRRVCGTFGYFGHVAPNCPRRDSDSDFEQQFIGNAFLTPSRIVDGHFGN